MFAGPTVWCRFGGPGGPDATEVVAPGRFLGSTLVVCPLPDASTLGNLVRVEVSSNQVDYTSDGVEAPLHSP
jgi:hypothetical protein